MGGGSRCVDILQPDITWVGGLTEAKKIYSMAAAYDLPGNTPRLAYKKEELIACHWLSDSAWFLRLLLSSAIRLCQLAYG